MNSKHGEVSYQSGIITGLDFVTVHFYSSLLLLSDVDSTNYHNEDAESLQHQKDLLISCVDKHISLHP